MEYHLKYNWKQSVLLISFPLQDLVFPVLLGEAEKKGSSSNGQAIKTLPP